LLRLLSLSYRSGHIRQLENEFCTYLGCAHAIATSFGRTSLLIGLNALEVSGKEVIIPTFICTVVRNAVTLAGATPRFVDISATDFTYDVEQLERNITNKTAAILLVHYFGRVARNIESVLALSRRTGIPIIEDCAHTLGATYANRKIGTFGIFSIFSLTKNTLNFGGGLMATDDDRLYQRARSIVESENATRLKNLSDFPKILAYGIEQAVNKLLFDRFHRIPFKYHAMVFPRTMLMTRRFILRTKTLVMQRRSKPSRLTQKTGHDADTADQSAWPVIRMSSMIAAIGSSQLQKVDRLNLRRQEITRALSQLPNTLLPSKRGMQDVCTHLPLHFPVRDVFRLISTFKRHGILLRATWPTHQRLWAFQDTPNILKIKNQILTYDVSPMLTESEIQHFMDVMVTSAHLEDVQIPSYRRIG
jgi:dTDP-4-amino-4,6-dideoxygalactose transaminase